MKKVTAFASILAHIMMVYLLAISDVMAGAAQTPAGKTTGPGQTATIVIDLTDGADSKGLTSMRVQRSGSNSGAMFNMSAVPNTGVDCQKVLSELQVRFVGFLIDWFVPGSVRSALFGASGDKAAITDVDYGACTTVTFPNNGGEVRTYLSFTAVIQFQQK